MAMMRSAKAPTLESLQCQMGRTILPADKMNLRQTAKARRRQQKFEQEMLSPTENILRCLDKSLESFDHALASLEKTLSVLD